MSDASIDAVQSSLLEGPDAPKKPETHVIAQVAKDFGVHPLRQMREILSMRFGAQKLGSQEYYSLRLFDPDMPMAEKRTYLGQGGTNALNTTLNPPVAVPTRCFVGNKLLYTELLAKLGVATSETQALVSTFRQFGKMPVLRDAESLATFLREKAVYPIFGKPHHGSLSEGSVRIRALEDDMLQLADGRSLAVDQFANDVMKHYPGGFMLQTALDPHAEMAEVAGSAVGCVRVVTVNDGTGVKPGYALWKLPAPKAMSDNFWQEGSLLAMIDLDSGEVTRCQRGTGVKCEDLADHPISGAPVVGKSMPFWRETLDLAVEAHNVFPEFGVCGFDVAVTPDGPKILECNDNPAHMLYQLAAGRGIQNADMKTVWDAVAQRQTRQLKRMSGK